jgi:DNA-directed RNA polymerase specialized sigma24 family protein
MAYLETFSKGSLAMSRQAAITELFDRSFDELRWLATVIIGHGQDAELCIVRAGQLAEEGSVVSQDWLGPWAMRCLARAAIERIRADVQRVASDYTRRSQLAGIPLALNSEEKQILRSIGSKEICAACNVLERAALILHAYLGFSVQDSALLLGCHRSVIEPACSNALQKVLQIGPVSRLALEFFAGCRSREAR